MSALPTVRWRERIFDVKSIGEADQGDYYPIHFAGAALFLDNQSNTEVEACVEESSNGVTWNLVLLSYPNSSGNAGVNLQGQAQRAVFFVSDQRYVRVRLSRNVPEGVFVWLVEYPPIPREPVVVY